MKAKSLVSALAFVSATGVALAGHMPCSVKPPAGTAKSGLAAMAKITQADAEKAAVASAPSGTVSKTELEVEHGCLVYEVKVKGSDNKTREIMVDAGDGKVLGDDDHHEKK